MGVEQPQLLAAVHGVEGVVDVEHDPLRHLRGRRRSRGRPAPGPCAAASAHPASSPGARWSTAKHRSRPDGSDVRRQLEQRIGPQGCGVVAVLVAGGDHQQAEADDVGEGVHDLVGRARIVDAGGQPLGDTQPLLDLAQHQHARRRTTAGPPSNRATTDLPDTGDRPGSGSIGSFMAGGRPENRTDWLQQPNPTRFQWAYATSANPP